MDYKKIYESCLNEATDPTEPTALNELVWHPVSKATAAMEDLINLCNRGTLLDNDDEEVMLLSITYEFEGGFAAEVAPVVDGKPNYSNSRIVPLEFFRTYKYYKK